MTDSPVPSTGARTPEGTALAVRAGAPERCPHPAAVLDALAPAPRGGLVR